MIKQACDKDFPEKNISSKKSPSAPSRKKERKNERNLPSIFLKSQYDTFQWLMAPHSLVTGARGGEAQGADAAARHQGRSKPWAKKKKGPIPGIYRNFLNTRGLLVCFPIPGFYQSCH